MAWTWQVIGPARRNPGNFNIEVTIQYNNGKNSYTEMFGAVDLTDAAVAEQARKRIKNVFEPGDAAMAAITVDTLPTSDLPDDPNAKLADIQAANNALMIAARKAQLKALNDPDVDAALIALDAAQASISTAVSADKP